MTRWRTFVECPKKCGGELEAYEADTPGVRYEFICSVCDFQGVWKRYARHVATYRGLRNHEHPR